MGIPIGVNSVRDRIRAVLVDLGDTLVHLNKPWEDVFEANLRSIYRYLRGAGVKEDFDKFSTAFIRAFDDASSKSDLYKIEIPMQEIISRVLGKFGVGNPYQGFVQGAMEEYYRPELQSWEAYPDAIEALVNLDNGGYLLGLVSNAKSDWAVHAILRKNELDKFFKITLTSAALQIRKPRPEIFIRTLERVEC